MQQTMLGAYGSWAADLLGEDPGQLSFRHPRWDDLEVWRAAGHERLQQRLAPPPMPATPDVTVHGQTEHDGVIIEALSWQLPYGPRTEAVCLKPVGATGKLPAILGLHCHGGNKFFGRQKIADLGEERHPIMVDHHDRYYGGVAWANQLAKQGYVVLVHDAFAFGSRRVRLADVPAIIRDGNTDPAWDDRGGIEQYNRWAANHESIVAKSLFSAGTTWPGVWLTEDRVALSVLCARADVDEGRVGCCGLSGGGLRTVFLGGVDPRIQCAVAVGMMTTWRDLLLHKSHTHTWMIYVPLLPNDMDYPEILGLRAPKPTLVLNDLEDQLFTLPEMQRADTILRDLYVKADATDRYCCTFYPGPHKFDLEMQAEAFAWFDQWL